MPHAPVESEPPGAPGRQDFSGPSALTVELAAPDRLVERPPLAPLHALAHRAVAAALGPRLSQGGHELRVRIVGDAEMAAAHQRYSGVPGTTDVLTFDLTDGASAASAPLDADVLICLDEARRQSARRGIPIEHELTLYILHAALHCLGEDDVDEPAAARMHAREDAILTSLGLAPVYAAPEREGR